MADRAALDAEPRFRAGVECFNRAKFFDAHEVWEDLWRESAVDDERRLLQALIQLAAAYHHVQRGDTLHRGSLRGASRLFHSALARLEARFADNIVPAALDLAPLIRAAQRDVGIIDEALAVAQDDAAPDIPGPPHIGFP